VRLVLVSGSTRAGSTCTAALRTAAAAAPPGIEARLWERLAEVPAFVPEADHDGGGALTELREQIGEADAVLICTPEYAGSLPGSFKNTLDWLVGSGELYRKPVAWTTVAAPGRGGGAEAALEGVLRYLDADILAPACMRIPVHRSAIGAGGLVDDAEVRAQLVVQLRTIAEQRRPAGAGT
jgi:chromate reductase, NAD(P)H dehydrogenase (quinone)